MVEELDVFHIFFGLTALSVMGHYDLELIDNTYAIPVDLPMFGPYWPAPTSKQEIWSSTVSLS
jgi:hypothetical protein